MEATCLLRKSLFCWGQVRKFSWSSLLLPCRVLFVYGLVFYTLGVFERTADINFRVCPKHRDSFGIKWRGGKNFARFLRDSDPTTQKSTRVIALSIGSCQRKYSTGLDHSYLSAQVFICYYSYFWGNVALTTVSSNKALLPFISFIRLAICRQCREKLKTSIATNEKKSKQVWKKSERNQFSEPFVPVDACRDRAFFLSFLFCSLPLTRIKREFFPRVACAAGISCVSLIEGCGYPVATSNQCSRLVTVVC